MSQEFWRKVFVVWRVLVLALYGAGTVASVCNEHLWSAAFLAFGTAYMARDTMFVLRIRRQVR